jgi:hypothetical protein
MSSTPEIPLQPQSRAIKRLIITETPTIHVEADHGVKRGLHVEAIRG